ncbi:MAG: methyltransferase domain-containing protein [Anaerolineae bacterium]|nr:methyltransferase domain-containing protein [Anaerolineae bacterium]
MEAIFPQIRYHKHWAGLGRNINVLNKVANMHHTPQQIGQSKWLVPSRIDQPELLDSGIGSQADVRQNLADLWRINVHLGGLSSLERNLYPRLRNSTHRLFCLDIGTGSAQIPLKIEQWVKQHNLQLEMLALDFSARNLRVAQEHLTSAPLSQISLIQADAHVLPFAPNSVDYVISSLFLHHLNPEQVLAFLRSTFRIARRGLIMTDLTRGWLPLLAFKIIQPIFARNYLTRHDGAVSIRRAYTPAELLFLAKTADLPNASISVYPSWPWRMTLVAEKP